MNVLNRFLLRPLIEIISLLDFFSGFGIGFEGEITFLRVVENWLGLEMKFKEVGLVELGCRVLEKFYAD